MIIAILLFKYSYVKYQAVTKDSATQEIHFSSLVSFQFEFFITVPDITNNYVPRSTDIHRFLSVIDCERTRGIGSFVNASYDNNIVQYRVAVYSIAMYNSTL